MKRKPRKSRATGSRNYATGRRNAAFLYPETRARGDRNGARLHPERLARGERHGLAKLTADIVRELRRLHRDGATLAELAKLVDVTKQAIWYAVQRVTWRHVA